MSSSQMSTDQYQVLNRRPLVMSVPPELLDPKRMDLEYYRPQYVDVDNLLRFAGYDLASLESLREESRPISYGVLKPVSIEDGVSLIRNQNFLDSSVDFENCVRIPWEQHQQYIRSEVRPGDLLVTIGGYVGNAAIVNQGVSVANINQHIARCSIDTWQADVHFLWAFLTSHIGTLLLQRQVTGSVQRGINLGDLRLFDIPIPPRPVQEHIGDKVRLAERCRTRARGLWEASEQLLSEALGMLLGTEHFEQINQVELRSDSYQLASANPVVTWVQSDIVERELGPHYFHPRRANVILKLRSSGVELKRLADLAERRNERVRADKVSQVPYYVGLADIDSMTGYFEPISPKEAGISGTSALFKSGDILFSKLRPYLNKVSICPAHVKQACGSTELLVYRANQSVLSYYVFFAIKSNVGLYQIIDVTAGSTLPRVDPEIVDDILVPLIRVEHQQTIDASICQAFALRHRATQLVREAKADVEALIEGQLDVEGIVAGRVQPPTW